MNANVEEKKEERPGRKKRPARTTRIPFGVARRKLSLDDETHQRLKANDLVPRWINDEEDGQRIKAALAGGYEMVTTTGDEIVGTGDAEDAARHIRRPVGTGRDGKPKYAYLMAIKREFYEEDQIAKEKKNQLVDEAIRGGKPPNLKDHGLPKDQASTFVSEIKYQP